MDVSARNCLSLTMPPASCNLLRVIPPTFLLLFTARVNEFARFAPPPQPPPRNVNQAGGGRGRRTGPIGQHVSGQPFLGMLRMLPGVGPDLDWVAAGYLRGRAEAWRAVSRPS